MVGSGSFTAALDISTAATLSWPNSQEEIILASSREGASIKPAEPSLN